MFATTAERAACEDWPHFRGPNRNGVVSASSGWNADADWPSRELWKINVGEGATSPVVVDGRLYTMGWREGRDHLHCLDARTGRTLWSVTYQCPRYGRKAVGDEGLYSGPSSTPAFDRATGFLYTLSVDGDLNCWDTGSRGQKRWGINLYESFDVEQRPKVGRSSRRDYGYTSSPLVAGNELIVEVGAQQGCLIAFDKQSGERLWVSQSTAPAGHTGGPVPFSVEGVSCAAVMTHDGLLVVRLDRGHQGETVVEVPWETSFANNIASPTILDNAVVLTSDYNQARIAKYEITLQGARKTWEQQFASKVCSPVIHDGYVYIAWRSVMCFDFQTGELQWRGGSLRDAASLIATDDDRLILWSDRGDLRLFESATRSPQRYTEVAVQRDLARADVWPHVVLADGVLYCKDRNGNLSALQP